MASNDNTTPANIELINQTPFFNCKSDFEEIDHLIELAENEYNKLDDVEDAVDEFNESDSTDIQVTKEFEAIMNQYKQYLAIKSLEIVEDSLTSEELILVSPSLNESLNILLKGKNTSSENRTEC
jgi:hypothetical protein